MQVSVSFNHVCSWCQVILLGLCFADETIVDITRGVVMLSQTTAGEESREGRGGRNTFDPSIHSLRAMYYVLHHVAEASTQGARATFSLLPVD